LPAKKLLNGDLLTSEEIQSPMGLGYVQAAERLGLVYLYDLNVIARLLVDYANEADAFSQTAHLPAAQFWPAMNKKADKLAVILKGKNPAYMATPWFTDPNQLAASLLRWTETRKQNYPADPIGKKDPVRGCCRDFMAFFLELYAGTIEGKPEIPDATLKGDHIKNYLAAFMGLDVANLQISFGTASPPIDPEEEDVLDEDA
jgi:hypothetical protein